MSYVASRPTPKLYLTSLEAHNLSNSLQTSNQANIDRENHVDSQVVAQVITESVQQGSEEAAGSVTILTPSMNQLPDLREAEGGPSSVNTTDPDRHSPRRSEQDQSPDKTVTVPSLRSQTELESHSIRTRNLQSVPPSLVPRDLHAEGFIFSRDQEFCTCAQQKGVQICPFASKVILSLAKHGSEVDLLKQTYEFASRKPVPVDQQRQILIDVFRTYSELNVYQSAESESTRALCRVLQALSVHFKSPGYVQGLNFLVASLRYHLQEEYLTFWATVYLFNCMEMHKNYNPGLPGLHHHASKFLLMMRKYLPEVVQAFDKASILPEMYLTEWLLPLGHYHLPLQDTGSFLLEVWEHGWPFMYRFMLEYIGFLSPALLAGEEEFKLYEILKFYARHRNIPIDPKSGMQPIDWQLLIEVAKSQLNKPDQL